MNKFSGISRKDAKTMVGKGWGWLLDILYDHKPRNIHVIQVKEKFATLRFYTDYVDETFEKYIDMCERESAFICERCGKTGKLRDDSYWIVTLCDECQKLKLEHKNDPNPY